MHYYRIEETPSTSGGISRSILQRFFRCLIKKDTDTYHKYWILPENTTQNLYFSYEKHPQSSGFLSFIPQEARVFRSWLYDCLKQFKDLLSENIGIVIPVLLTLRSYYPISRVLHCCFCYFYPKNTHF